jgi:hypothetical protein
MKFVVVLVVMMLAGSFVVGAELIRQDNGFSPRIVVPKIKDGCASSGQRASEYAGGCCRGLLTNQRGICSRPTACSKLNEPAIFACCPGLESVNGFCRKALTEGQKKVLGGIISSAARGVAGSMPRMPAPQSCVPEGYEARALEAGCCAGLVERNGICRYETPQCIREGQSVDGGGMCCQGLVRSCGCVRPR